MTTLGAFLKQHPVLTFFVLAFAISWVGILLIIGGPSAYPGPPKQADSPLFILVMLAWFAGPSGASLLLTGLLYGRTGLRDLLTRLTRWRVEPRWYAVALLAAPLLYGSISLALSLFSPDFLPGLLVSDDKVGLLVMGIAYGLIGGGFLEELGWTGFAVPRLRLGYGAVATGLIVGILWGAYHFSVVYWISSPSGGLALWVILPVSLFAWLPPYRVLMVWVYDRTRSLLVAMLMHAPLSASMLILQPAAMAEATQLTWTLVLASVLWIVVAAVAVANRRQLSRQPIWNRVA